HQLPAGVTRAILSPHLTSTRRKVGTPHFFCFLSQNSSSEVSIFSAAIPTDCLSIQEADNGKQGFGSMKSEFILAFNEICEQRGLPKEEVFEALKTALVSAYRRDTNISAQQRVTVDIDPRTGEPTIYTE